MWILDKVDFRTKKISKYKGVEGHYIRKKESIEQEHILVLNMYTSNYIISKYLKQNSLHHINTPIHFTEIETVT